MRPRCRCKACRFEGTRWFWRRDAGKGCIDPIDVTGGHCPEKCGDRLLPLGETEPQVAESVALEALVFCEEQEACKGCMFENEDCGDMRDDSRAERVLAWATREAARRAAEGGGEGGR